MNILLWLLQLLLGSYFVITGIVHFVVPPGLPEPMAWMYELSPWLHYVVGTAEILAGLGLVLPGLLRRHTYLTPLAALGLVFVMLGAASWHLMRGEYASIVMNLALAALAAFIGYGRWKLAPLSGSNAQRGGSSRLT
jgi:putative oxidoreductase